MDGNAIRDWPSFHAASHDAFGFPAFYGRNMDAWIDCLTYLYDGDGMSRFHLKAGETLEVLLTGSTAMEAQAPEVFAGLVGAIAAVNQRYVEQGESPALRLLPL